MKAPTNLLLLHACTFPGFAAFAQGGRLHVVPLNGSGRERRVLLGAVQEVLQRAGMSLDAVQGLWITLGPGSFTGIRVAIATAQGLAAARSWPIWACDSLFLDAAAWSGTEDPVAVCHDARRGEVYAALYDVSGGTPRSLVPPFCATPEAARARLLRGRHEERPLRWSGTGAALVNHESRDEAGALVSVESLAAAAASLVKTGELPSTTALALEPFYLRRPDVRPPHVAPR